MNQSKLIEDLKSFESERSYFVENDGYNTLADVRVDLETAFDHSEQYSKRGRRSLRKGDQLLLGLEGADPDARRNIAEWAVGHYLNAAREFERDGEYFENQLDSALNDIEAGINQVDYSRLRPSKTAKEAKEMADRYHSQI